MTLTKQECECGRNHHSKEGSECQVANRCAKCQEAVSLGFAVGDEGVEKPKKPEYCEKRGYHQWAGFTKKKDRCLDCKETMLV